MDVRSESAVSTGNGNHSSPLHSSVCCSLPPVLLGSGLTRVASFFRLNVTDDEKKHALLQRAENFNGWRIKAQPEKLQVWRYAAVAPSVWSRRMHKRRNLGGKEIITKNKNPL